MPRPAFITPELGAVYDDLPPDKQAVFEWMYDKLRPENSLTVTLIHGTMLAAAIANPTATFWEVAISAKKTLERNFDLRFVE